MSEKNCTTHHHACECREARFRRMEQALRVIEVWAEQHKVKAIVADSDLLLGMIAQKAREALYD